MPTYPYHCEDCKVSWDVKMTFKEHDEVNVVCPECGQKAIQTVTKLNFRLAGEGWFGSSADANPSPYGLTQTELNKNLEHEKRVEDFANTMAAKDENIMEI